MNNASPMAQSADGRPSPTATAETVASLLGQFALAQATELARDGLYAEAEALLQESSAASDRSAATLHLLARMRAQQGRLREAEELWLQTTQLEPNNPEYRAALSRIAKLQKQPPTFLRAGRLVLVLAGLAVVLLLAVALRDEFRRPVESLARQLASGVETDAAANSLTLQTLRDGLARLATDQQATTQKSDETRTSLDRLVRQQQEAAQQARALQDALAQLSIAQISTSNGVKNLQMELKELTQTCEAIKGSLAGLDAAVGHKLDLVAEAQEAASTRLAREFKTELERATLKLPPPAVPRQPEAPRIELDIPGISSVTEGRELVLRFDHGLFSRGALFFPEARSLLTKLGGKLAPYAGQIMVEVIGFTDERPALAWWQGDDVALGMKRATAVVSLLRSSSGLPARMFSVRSLGQSSLPFPNGTLENHLRNRTAVIRIARPPQDSAPEL